MVTNFLIVFRKQPRYSAWRGSCLAIAFAFLLQMGCETSSTPSTNPTPNASTDTSSSSPTNSGINERDRESTAKTPIDQSGSQQDIDITAKIRKQIVATDMSTNAHNVKIITQDGKVTLRGPVDSEDEKTRIEKIAHDVAGADQVENQIEVAP